MQRHRSNQESALDLLNFFKQRSSKKILSSFPKFQHPLQLLHISSEEHRSFPNTLCRKFTFHLHSTSHSPFKQKRTKSRQWPTTAAHTAEAVVDEEVATEVVMGTITSAIHILAAITIQGTSKTPVSSFSCPPCNVLRDWCFTSVNQISS